MLITHGELDSFREHTVQTTMQYSGLGLTLRNSDIAGIKRLVKVLNDFMFRKEISTCNFYMIYGIHMFKAD